VPEHQHVDIAVLLRASPFPAGRGPGLVDHRDVNSAERLPRDRGESRAQLRTVVVPIDADKSTRALLESVERGDVYPVPGVDHDVSRGYRLPHLAGQVSGSPRDVGVREDQ